MQNEEKIFTPKVAALLAKHELQLDPVQSPAVREAERVLAERRAERQSRVAGCAGGAGRSGRCQMSIAEIIMYFIAIYGLARWVGFVLVHWFAREPCASRDCPTCVHDPCCCEDEEDEDDGR